MKHYAEPGIVIIGLGPAGLMALEGAETTTGCSCHHCVGRTPLCVLPPKAFAPPWIRNPAGTDSSESANLVRAAPC